MGAPALSDAELCVRLTSGAVTAGRARKFVRYLCPDADRQTRVLALIADETERAAWTAAIEGVS